jgi:hypothetical protein
MEESLKSIRVLERLLVVSYTAMWLFALSVTGIGNDYEAALKEVQKLRPLARKIIPAPWLSSGRRRAVRSGLADSNPAPARGEKVLCFAYPPMIVRGQSSVTNDWVGR